jgi:hypothetical protein
MLPQIHNDPRTLGASPAQHDPMLPQIHNDPRTLGVPETHHDPMFPRMFGASPSPHVFQHNPQLDKQNPFPPLVIQPGSNIAIAQQISTPVNTVSNESTV